MAKTHSKPAVSGETFDLSAFLKSKGAPFQVVKFRPGAFVYRQGDPAVDIRYIVRGSVRLSAMSTRGKEAVVGTFLSGDFFGEGVLAGETQRLASAKAASPSAVLAIDATTMRELLHQDPELSDAFISFMLARNMRVEADLVDQLLNSSEKRLARALILLAKYGDPATARTVPKVSQETLAEMIGTTRGRVSFFMNRFKKMGFIDYNGEITVKPPLLNMLLRD